METSHHSCTDKKQFLYYHKGREITLLNIIHKGSAQGIRSPRQCCHWTYNQTNSQMEYKTLYDIYCATKSKLGHKNFSFIYFLKL